MIMIHCFKNLVVGSVFIPHERSQKWYDLQIKYLKKTCSNFHHLVYVNGDMDHSIFKYSEIIGSSSYHAGLEAIGGKQSENHSQGLQVLLSKFRSMPAMNYLILDSDYFPVLSGWNEILIDRMKDRFKIAAPIRCENLDTFPHPSAMFIKGNCIHEDWLDFKLDIDYNFGYKNFLGDKLIDVGCRIPINVCYPLIRSNFRNLHPLFAGVYNHMFYHHGCGSRKLETETRMIYNEYLDHYMKKEDHLCVDYLFEKLIENPELFIDNLMSKPILK